MERQKEERRKKERKRKEVKKKAKGNGQMANRSIKQGKASLGAKVDSGHIGTKGQKYGVAPCIRQGTGPCLTLGRGHRQGNMGGQILGRHGGRNTETSCHSCI